MKNKIYIILIVALLVVGGIVFWGSKQHNRFDTIVLKDNGSVLDTNYQTIQFAKKDIVYRNWNNEQVLLTNNEDTKDKVFDNSMFVMENGDLMFLSPAPTIDESGVARNTDGRVVYSKVESGYKNDNSNEILENEIVKLDNRQYFVAGSGKLLVDGELIGEISNPLLLIDKTGSVTAVVDNNTKKERYIGHLVIELDENHKVDISDEKYYVNDTIIDLTKYGGSDNEKLVLLEEEKESKKAEESVDNNKDSNGNSIDNIADMNKAISKINDKLSGNKIPIVELTSTKVFATKINSNLFVSDPSNTLVGQLQFDILNENGKVVKTSYESAYSNNVNISGLNVNSNYTLRLKYKYDLGDGKGIVTRTTNVALFTTQNVSAIYEFSQIGASTFTVDISLDAIVDDVKSAKLHIYNNNDKIVNTISVDPNVLNSGGSRLVVSSLNENSSYYVKLEIILGTNDKLSFKQSRMLTTKSAVQLKSYNLERENSEQFSLNYDLELYDYALENATVELSEKKIFGTENIPVEIIKNKDSNISFIPLKEADNIDATLRVSLSNKNKNRDFIYDVGSVDFKKQNQLIFNEFKKGENSSQIFNNYDGELVFTMRDAANSSYEIVFEKKGTDGFEKIINKSVDINTDKDIEINGLISKYSKKDIYRVVVYDTNDGIVNYTYLEKEGE
ncbi:MAG: hypothetical protein ACK5NF_05320 [Bacilli bacterium]